jgi:opacity protein-like surface antigen
VAGIANEGNWDGVMTSVFGGSIGIHTGQLIVAEAEILRLNNLLPSPAFGTLRADWLGGNVLIPVRTSGWRPFGLAGIGVGRVLFKQTRVPDQANTGAAFNLGGGLMMPVARRVALRTDIRWLAIFDGYDDFYRITRITAGAAFGL